MYSLIFVVDRALNDHPVELLFQKRSDFVRQYLPLLTSRYNSLVKVFSETIGLRYCATKSELVEDGTLAVVKEYRKL